MNSPPIKVLVVDDHPLIRYALSAIIDNQSDLDVVGQAANAAEAIALFDAVAPDVTLVDLSLPDLSGIQLIAILREKSPTARFLVLTANAGGSEIGAALHAGAQAYLFKNSASEELLAAIRTVFLGGRYLSPAVGRKADEFSPLPEMTPRELEVLGLMVRGYSNPQIASEIGVTKGTVKFHVGNILSKLGVNSRSQAIAMVLKARLGQ